MSEEWCRKQLMNLQIKDRRLDTLNEIRNHLTNLPADEVASVSSNFLTLSELFDCVEDNQERFVFSSISSLKEQFYCFPKTNNIPETNSLISLVTFSQCACRIWI